MNREFTIDRNFERTDNSTTGLISGDYENCTFSNCNFSSVDLSATTFSECTFIDCNISMAKLTRTSFRDAKFKGCKLLGLHFENCSEFLFSVDFDGCNLNLSSFFRKNLKKPRFINCTPLAT